MAISALEFLIENKPRLNFEKLAVFILENSEDVFEDAISRSDDPRYTFIKSRSDKLAYGNQTPEELVDRILESNIPNLKNIVVFAIRHCLTDDYNSVGDINNTELAFLLNNLDKVDFYKLAEYLVENENDIYRDALIPNRYIHIINKDCYANLTPKQLFQEYDGLLSHFEDDIVIYAITNCMNY